MTYKVITVCYRCGQHRGVVTRDEQGKRRGYCGQCAAFLRGQISEADAPRERPALTAQRTGWMKLYRRAPENSDDLA
jgi:hypothetical protein